MELFFHLVLVYLRISKGFFFLTQGEHSQDNVERNANMYKSKKKPSMMRCTTEKCEELIITWWSLIFPEGGRLSPCLFTEQVEAFFCPMFSLSCSSRKWKDHFPLPLTPRLWGPPTLLKRQNSFLLVPTLHIQPVFISCLDF